MNTTLNAIREHSPCQSGWDSLLAGLGKTQADDEPLPYTTILDINGLDDAIWALRTCDDRMRVLTYACECAERVVGVCEAQYPDDARVRDCITALRGYIAGTVSRDGLDAAVDAAARAAYSARAAAYSAAYSATYSAAYAAAYAARAAADAARAAEREWQETRYRELFGAYIPEAPDQFVDVNKTIPEVRS